MARGQLGTVCWPEAQHFASQVAKAANLSVWLRVEIGREKQQLGAGDNRPVEHPLSTRQALGSALSAKSDSNETAASFVSRRWRSRALWLPVLPRGVPCHSSVQGDSSSPWSWPSLRFPNKEEEDMVAWDLAVSHLTGPLPALTDASCWGQKEKWGS